MSELRQGFVRTHIETSGAEIVVNRGGSGPPLLLMHSNPFTHVKITVPVHLINNCKGDRQVN